MTRHAVDVDVPLRFLRTAYEAEDWIAVLLKTYDTGRAAQRVAPVSRIARPGFQAWLRAENAGLANVYVSVNALTAGRRSRRREAVSAVRHLFLDIDANAARVLAQIERRDDLPAPSYVIRSSPGRAQVFWRVSRFTCARAEAVQKQLAQELGADAAATTCAQMARLPGFRNHKYSSAPIVSVEFRDATRMYEPSDFPDVGSVTVTRRVQPLHRNARTTGTERARQYVAAIPPAIVGQHGDVQTFRVCCRLVRGFALTDADAFAVLTDWNGRCQPPWSESELRQKLRSARQYGREPMGGLLEWHP